MGESPEVAVGLTVTPLLPPMKMLVQAAEYMKFDFRLDGMVQLMLIVEPEAKEAKAVAEVEVMTGNIAEAKSDVGRGGLGSITTRRAFKVSLAA